jgi:pimeloyl-ACP methyl ester carboxylesterase
VPLLKLYDSFDPIVVRSSTGPNPIAANYTAPLAVLYSHARRVAGSAAASFLRPDTPRFATGIYMIHPYDPKIPVLFIHGLISSPISWQNLANDLCSDPKILEHYQPWFFLYPTGQPVLESALQLREDLQATRRLFDPKGSAIASRHVVVIAHSMGDCWRTLPALLIQNFCSVAPDYPSLPGIEETCDAKAAQPPVFPGLLDRIVRASSDRRSDIVRLMTAITISTGVAARFEDDTHAQPSDVVRRSQVGELGEQIAVRAYLISVTFPFVRISRKASTASSVSVRPLPG